MSEFHVGQKIVCVEAPVHNGYDTWGWEIFPIKGRVYTIRQILPEDDEGDIGILLVEIVNRNADYDSAFGELEFCQDYFRPLASKAISIFRKIAADVSEGKKVKIDG